MAGSLKFQTFLHGRSFLIQKTQKEPFLPRPQLSTSHQSWLTGLQICNIFWAFSLKVKDGRWDRPSAKYILATRKLHWWHLAPNWWHSVLSNQTSVVAENSWEHSHPAHLVHPSDFEEAMHQHVFHPWCAQQVKVNAKHCLQRKVSYNYDAMQARQRIARQNKKEVTPAFQHCT